MQEKRHIIKKDTRLLLTFLHSQTNKSFNLINNFLYHLFLISIPLVILKFLFLIIIYAIGFQKLVFHNFVFSYNFSYLIQQVIYYYNF